MQRLALELGKSGMNISDEAISYLMSLEWPENIRELNNSLEQAIVLADGNILNLSVFNTELHSIINANLELTTVLSS